MTQVGSSQVKMEIRQEKFKKRGRGSGTYTQLCESQFSGALVEASREVDGRTPSLPLEFSLSGG